MDESFENSPILWNGNYEKVVYAVHLPDGAKIECWPNAGMMNAMDGSGRSWVPEDKVMVSVCSEHHALRSDGYKKQCAEAARQLRDTNADAVETAVKEELIVSVGQAGTLSEKVAHLRLRGAWAPLAGIDFVSDQHPDGLRLDTGETITVHFPQQPIMEAEARAALRLQELFSRPSMGSLRARETKRLKRQRYLEKKRKQ